MATESAGIRDYEVQTSASFQVRAEFSVWIVANLDSRNAPF